MSGVIKTLPNQPRKALEALAMFRFMTVNQFVRLGIGASSTVVRDHVLKKLERGRRPFAKSKKLGTFLPKVHYLTKYGAEELANIYKLPIEGIRYPKGQVQFSETLARHRFAQVDFHIGFRQWAHSRSDVEFNFATMDFDVEGSRLHGTFKNPTAILLPDDDRPVIADGIFSLELNGVPLLYALEVHRTTQTKAVAHQIQRYIDVIQTGALSFKYEQQAPVYVCSVHTKENVLRGAKYYLRSNPALAPFRKFFLFNTAKQLDEDFSDGWHFADDSPASPFSKPVNPTIQPLFT